MNNWSTRGGMPQNKQLERTVIRHRVCAASAAAPLCARGAHATSARGRSTARSTNMEAAIALAQSVARMTVAAALLLSASLISAQPTLGVPDSGPPIVMPAESPPETASLNVQWVKVAVPNEGTMLAAVARPAGVGQFPAVLILHGTHGFAREYVEFAEALARDGFLAVAACWFTGGRVAEQPVAADGDG